mmetsp:Transcript_66093/g.144092  ORF Transcript_66093/g.144092 Transcript_66093/m.144092 type:complete len:146 (-) Transcript_66093:108-545(-)
MDRVKQAKLAGPVLISSGSAEQLKKFVELNPMVPPQLAFVDASPDRDAYTAVGFGKLGPDMPPPIGAKVGMPELEFGEWGSYLGSFVELAPKPKESEPNSLPEGVLQLGGTLVLRGNQVVYAYPDKVPGDHPLPDVVLTQVEAME